MSRSGYSNQLNSVLYYGYPLPNESVGLPQFIQSAASPHKHDAPESVLVDEGKHALRDAMKSIVTDLPENATHVLSLSGGLDSRVVLGLLTEAVDRSQIHTITIGLPIGLDYEIGQQVAKAANVRNTPVNPTTWTDEWAVDNLVAHAANYPYPNQIIGGYLQHLAREKVVTDIDRDYVLWNGFMGETLAGAHLSKYGTDNSTWEQACESFASTNQRSTIDFTPSGFDPIEVLPSDPWISRDALSYAEQLDFAIRQQCWIRQIVGRYGHSPFLQPHFVEYILNLPQDHRKNRSIFKTIAKNMFPDLFRLPTQTNDGAPLSAGDTRRRLTIVKNTIEFRLRQVYASTVARPGDQFMDFDTELRRKWSFAETVKTLVSEMDQRDVIDWFDPLEIWKRHQNGENLSRDLRVLANLEAFLQSEESAPINAR